MKRRSFLKRLGLAVAAVTTGAAALPAKAKTAAETFGSMPIAELGDVDWILDPWPMRFEWVDGEFVHVNPYAKHGKYFHPNPKYCKASHEAAGFPEM